MSTNPFDDNSNNAARPSAAAATTASIRSSRSALRSSNMSRRHHQHREILLSEQQQPAIWAARNVEWPIPSALSVANYLKLVKASKQAGQHLGITTTATTTTTTTQAMSSVDAKKNLSGELAEDGDATAAAAETNYYGLTGFMSRVLNTSGAASEKSGDDLMSDAEMMAHNAAASAVATSSTNEQRGARPLRPPRQHCVAAANGWIIAVLECPSSPSPSPSSSSNHAVVLRLVSRWNVRRGGMADQWMALPPPMNGDGKILHVFVDPTASHTFLSAANGEAYYIHSSQKQAIKLVGFGVPVDGTTAPSKKDLTGLPATAVAHRRDEAAQAAIQAGLSMGSHVTAIAWDKERGTEGSSKKILLGTSAGEIYEYSLVSPNSEDQEEAAAQPMLLHKLYTDSGDPTEVGAAVTGLYFERLRTGLLVMAATSGRHKRTRFYTFYSAHSSSFRMVMADQQHASLVELPGSVDFADLRLCNDNFGLRTATGIYYGTIDRSLSGQAVLSGGSNVITDSGILPYYDGAAGKAGRSSSASSASSVPVSLAITPHHLITLSESNDVYFISRVAQKTIQKERVDLSGQTSASSSSVLDESHIGVGELMMDIRRPDQVWLRKARSLVHISSSQEDRDVWKFTLQKCLDMPMKSRSRADESPESRGPSISKNRLYPTTFLPTLTEEEKAQEALFEQAKTLCTNSAQKAVVTAIRAEYHLSQGRAELSAKYLAQCPSVLEPFADTSIRLALPKLGIDDPQSYGGSSKARVSLESSNVPLISYLGDKMRVGTMNDDKMTSTMIGAWLTELYLHERGERLNSAPFGETKVSNETQSTHRALLAQFLNSNVNNMDAKTIMKILTSHDVGAAECAVYAAKSGDIATAVNAALSIGSKDTSGAYEALQILDDAPFELAESLYYKHAPILLARAPEAAGDSFLARYSQGLSPTRLLPSIMHYERTREERARSKLDVESAQSSGSLGGVEESKRSIDVSVDAQKVSGGFELQVVPGGTRTASFVDDSAVSIKYLEGVINQGCRSSAVFSYLVSLYAKLEDEDPLYAFLSTHVPAAAPLTDAAKKASISQRNFRTGSNEDLSSPLDMSYALRIVLTSQRHFRSAIKLYMGFGMRQQAVELALKVDPSLARDLAQESVELEERRRLWLMIAKNAASDGSSRGGKDVVSRVVSVLKDCGPDVLSIEDVLPFLPDFAQIDQIKDEICEALTSYSSKIEGFLKEMSDCDEVCDNLREEIGRLRNHRMRMKADARCAFTNKLVLSAGEPFYVFPSGYVILASALKKEVLPYLNEKQRKRVDELENLLKSSKENFAREALQTELDGLLAAECPLTGSVMVESIDRDFEGSTEIDEEGGFPYVERVEV